MTYILFILNLLDYIITLILGDDLVEANAIMRPVIDNVPLLTLIKLIIIPFLILLLHKYRDKLITKICLIIAICFYIYAVVLGILLLFYTR